MPSLNPKRITELPGWLRQSVRNPSAPQVIVGLILVLFVVIGIPLIVYWPSISHQARQGYTQLQRSRQPALALPPEVNLRAWLVEQAHTMATATQPYQWHPANFQYGPCTPVNLEQFRNPDLRAALTQGCHDLDQIQQKYASDCAHTDECHVPQTARVELQQVIANLTTPFAGLSTPTSTLQSSPG